MAGRNFHLASDAPSAAVRWYALRSRQMFGLVDDVFGRDDGRLTHVIGGEMAAPDSPDDRIDREIWPAFALDVMARFRARATDPARGCANTN